MDIIIFKEYYNSLIANKKFILLYLLAIAVFMVLMFTSENWAYPNFEFGSIIFIVVVGIFLILYAFKNKDNIHNVAFVTIILFGLLMLIFTPPFIFPDEGIHFVRAEYITEGILLPQATPNGYLVQDYFFGLNAFRFGGTFFENSFVFSPITSHMGYWPETTQTPFYTYIFSAIGIFLAKCFDITAIGALWLARLGNLIFYAFVARFSIKKAQDYKMPMFVMVCLPLIVSQISSVSYDAFVFSLGILAVAYFINMLKNKVKNKDLLIFFVCCLLIGLIKPPYIALTFLVFFIPSKNFKSKRFKWAMLIPILILIGLSIGFTFNIFGTGNTAVNINPKSHYSPSEQLNYMLSHPFHLFNLFIESIKSFVGLFVTNLTFFHYADYKGIKYYNLLYLIFFVGFSILYPIKIKLEKNKRIILTIALILFYFGILFMVYLAWNPVGASSIVKVQPRYYVPFLPLIPLAINYPFKEIKNIDSYTITCVIIFLVGLFLLPITHYY